jgi:hypothetical protein
MNDRQDRTMNVVMFVLGIPLGILLAIWTLWITVTAFIGGQAPFFFIYFDGFSLFRGLLWLIIVDPIVLTVAYWIFMLIMFPIGALAAALGGRSDRDSAA